MPNHGLPTIERPGAAEQAASHDGVVTRRVLAYLIDVIIIGVLVGLSSLLLPALSIVSLGLLLPFAILAVAALPLAYHTLLIGGRHASTFGMRLFDLQVRNLGGARISYPQALVYTIVFYVSISLTGSLILLVGLVHPRSRCVHDILLDLAVVRLVDQNH